MARASVEPISWSALPCWWSAERWLAHVVAVYRRGYLLTRPQLVAATGGGVSLRAVHAVATAHARAGDYRTGRCSRPLLGVTGGTTGITATTQLGKRTVTRARTWLRLVGLATEVAPGRHRSFIERLASWERGDTRRGWTAEYALHPSPRFPDPAPDPVPIPVDNPGRVIAGQTVRGTPPRSGSSSPERSDGNVVTSTPNQPSTPAARDEDGAARRATTPGHAQDDFGGSEGSRTPATALMLDWRASERCPRWARQYGAHRWSGALSAAAAAGWTARDLNQLLTDLTTTGHQILTAPRRPISYLCHLLNLVDINERPTAIPDAQATAELAARTARTTAQLNARDTHTAARHTAVAALTGPGRAAALTAAHTTATNAAHRRSEQEAADRLALAEHVQHRRGHQ
ncbi:hypothetical protein RHODO2019_18640 (plasmid) [Rhodococcus antarcticus]|uniref:Replication protein n=1 Tax=Rhodococcus antarcticus TaxID=2987751 RepID=A0ABY6P5S0_9NOCA|nr:hypothetical protein [Rhodococcus antarcticus]UZJ27010.1 hypothetical protein RHODO2019_18640 [Rhodococcus antarcticus]